MKDCSTLRQFPALTHDTLGDSLAERPLPEATINRIAENEAKYSPHDKWDDQVQRFRDLMERST